MSTVLIAGCGYVGSALALRLAALGHTVWGLRRNTAALPSCARPFKADLLRPATLRPLPAHFDFVFYTAGAAGFTERDYRDAYVDGLGNLLDALEAGDAPPKRVFFTTSTGVYAQDDGSWLDEQSPTEPRRFSGKCLIEGEARLHAAPIPGTVLRLGGIYGPGRTRLLDNVRSGEARCVAGRTAYLNLIHRDDCAGALLHLMELDEPETVYLGVDELPVERCALLRWLAGALGVPEPRVVPATEAPEPQRGGNRRFRNTRLKASGYTFAFPNYREGYGALL